MTTTYADELRLSFANAYVQYLLKMDYVSSISQMDNMFFQLILFVNKDGEKFNDLMIQHRISDNSFYANKIFQSGIVFHDHGNESRMYMKYISDFCSDEVKIEQVANGPIQTFYGCDFKCDATFKLIADLLKNCGYSKEKLLEQQTELKTLKETLLTSNNSSDCNDCCNDNCGSKLQLEYNKKIDKFKQDVITVKNICLFRKLALKQ